MKLAVLIVLAGATSAAPALAQDWGQDYNMGSIGISGGSEANGRLVIDCAEAGNAVVPKGALTVFVRPPVRTVLGSQSPGQFDFDVDGTKVSLPVSDNQGDGFVYDKTAASLVDVTTLVDAIKTGKTLTITTGDTQVALIDLEGAATALDGIEACLVP